MAKKNNKSTHVNTSAKYIDTKVKRGVNGNYALTRGDEQPSEIDALAAAITGSLQSVLNSINLPQTLSCIV